VRTLGATLAVVIALIAAAWCAVACDTWVALPDSTGAGVTLLGKNSDRPAFDAQPLVLNLRATWPSGSEIDLGRLSIPQIGTTYATLGSQPYWCWGYEEGINEFGVAIGNEGVWTRPLLEMLSELRVGQDRSLGLTGMDLVRLALERARTAAEAVAVIGALLEEHGQLGSGVPTTGLPGGAYDNSYIIADAEEAWILETAGREWVARRVDSGVASISNDLSLGAEFDLQSSRVISQAVEKGWWSESSGSSFDFAAAYRDPSPIGQGKTERSIVRSEASRSLLEEQAGAIDVPWMMRIGRDRSSAPPIDQPVTASSCVAVLPTTGAGLPVFWWAAARPSVSCYVPFFVHASQLPDLVSSPGTHTDGVVAPSNVAPDAYSDESYWWIFRDLADLATGGVSDETDRVRAAFDPLEEEFARKLPQVLAEAERLSADGRATDAALRLSAFSAECVEEALAVANDLREQLSAELASYEIPEHLQPYIGTYAATFDDSVYSVVVKGGGLALDVPGQTVYELKDPDETGRWVFVLSGGLAVSFVSDASGLVTSLILYQSGLALEFLKEGFRPKVEVSAEQAAELVGEYADPDSEGKIEVLHQNGRLAVRLDDRMTLELHLPDTEGLWRARATDQIAVQFETGSAEETVGLELIRGSERQAYRKDSAGVDGVPGEPVGREMAGTPLATLLIGGLLVGLLIVLLASR